MNADARELSYRRTFIVHASPERAFEEFTNAKGGWWPHDHRRGKAPVLGVGFEPRVGGVWYERRFDGERGHRGSILAWEPPRRLLVSWPLKMGQDVDLETLGESEFELRFAPHGEGRCRVTLQHRHMERTPNPDKLAPFFSPYGWDLVVANYSAYLASEPWPGA